MRRGAYYQHLFIVRAPALCMRALSCLTQDRIDVLPSCQQFVWQLCDKVRLFLQS